MLNLESSGYMRALRNTSVISSGGCENEVARFMHQDVSKEGGLTWSGIQMISYLRKSNDEAVVNVSAP